MSNPSKKAKHNRFLVNSHQPPKFMLFSRKVNQDKLKQDRALGNTKTAACNNGAGGFKEGTSST
ncbi:hypothetical protein F4Z99_20760 [Candidatus Poribacteria bacterium]|nr:hypothetical protein [Candidatus Poribacteria bacterium]